jgi:cytochrome c peroxidase
MQEGSEVFVRAGCDRCHSGERYTDNANHDVGTGGEFQTPPLIGLRYSAPYMHDGCAKSLHERFDVQCGGAAHGSVNELSDADLTLLATYLEAL